LSCLSSIVVVLVAAKFWTGTLAELVIYPHKGGYGLEDDSSVEIMAGNLASTWRISTPPPSPPAGPVYLAQTVGNFRRVASVEFFSKSWDSSSRQSVHISGDRIQTLSTVLPRTSNVPGGGGGGGLAEVAAAGEMLTFGLSTLNLDSSAAAAPAALPLSTLYNWSCWHFSRPLLEPAQDEDVIIARRQEKEHLALAGITKCHHSSE
jgi:regulator-associated protein of mTOR